MARVAICAPSTPFTREDADRVLALAAGEFPQHQLHFHEQCFAIEGHYFNFSTSGRWLWDEVRIVVPAGHDPYPILEAVQKQIEEATAESAREAEAQWREARRSPHLGALTVAPSIHLRPIAGGVEIIARYITDVAQREELKAKLYYTAVNLLGGMSARATASIP